MQTSVNIQLTLLMLVVKIFRLIFLRVARKYGEANPALDDEIRDTTEAGYRA